MPKTDVAATLAALKPRDPVLIEWLDAHNLLDGWTSLELLSMISVQCTVRTLSHFLERRGEFIIVAADIILPDDESADHDVNTMCAIPVACITRLEVIQHG